MPNFTTGVIRFQQEVFPEKKEMFEKLSLGQSPEALFITCSDSRIETAMITQTDPGELFICRNAGNIVPPHNSQPGGMTASIEFAVSVLNVPHIVICGHTQCGAMQGAMNPEGLHKLPHVKQWLGFTQAAVEIVRELGCDLNEEGRMHMLLQQNVILQLRHIATHPCVAVRLAKGDLVLHGWIYDIKTGQVEVYDEPAGKFIPTKEKYAPDTSKEQNSCGCYASHKK